MFGKNDWIHFYKTKPNFRVEEYLKSLGVNQNKPIHGLATSVLWDAQIDFPSNFYKNSLEWIFDTIIFFSKNSSQQLIIRISPAELQAGKPARQKVYDEIVKKFKKIPSNIFIIRPEDNISSYKILDKCKYIFIYGSRIGIEMAARGKEVIVCGEGFIRNKKIALDVKSKKHYKKILIKIIKKNLKFENRNLIRAKKYAYHFFFRRMLEFKSIKEQQHKWPNFTISNDFPKNLINSSDPALEKTSEAIIYNSDFILDN